MSLDVNSLHSLGKESDYSDNQGSKYYPDKKFVIRRGFQF